jgi:hypothetical protein
MQYEDGCCEAKTDTLDVEFQVIFVAFIPPEKNL